MIDPDRSTLATSSLNRAESASRHMPRLGWTEITLGLIAGDVGAALVGILATVVLWAALPTDFVPGPYLLHWIVGSVVVWVLALGFFDGYDVVAPTFWRSSFGPVARAFLVVVGATAGAFFLLPFLFPRGVGILGPMATALAIVAWRGLARRVVEVVGLGRRVIVLGLDDASRRVAGLFIASRSGVSYKPVAFVTASKDAPATVMGLTVLGTPERLWEIVREQGIDEIIVGNEDELVGLSQLVLVECFARGVAATPAVSLYEALTGRVLASSLGPSWFTQIPTEARRPYLIIKRAVDVLVALAIAPVVLPLGLIVAGLVILTSGRPVIFRQVRLGQRGVPFVIHKFRTMTTTAEPEGPRFASRGDPRRTGAGRLLRRTHLDELPQLWDVFRGSMSLIGPRPERPEFVARLREQMPLYEARFLLPPGLTGWAQVRLPYAANLEESLMKLEYDLYYVKHVGPLLDISIALRTLGTLVHASGL